MKKLVAILVLVGFCFFLAFAQESLKTILNAPTPGPMAYTATAGADQIERTIAAERKSTSVAMNLESIRVEGTAQAAQSTAEVYRSIQTADAFERAAQTQAVSLAKTQEADRQNQEATIAAEQQNREATAVVAATERAWGMRIQEWTATASSAEATSTVSAQTTASAAAATLTIRAGDLAFSQQQAQATATIAALIADQRERQLEIERQETINKIQAITPWAILVLGFLIASGLVIAYANWRARFQIVKSGANGDKPVVVINGLLVDMDRAASAVVDPRRPQDLPLDAQMQLTAGDQRVDQTRAMPRVVNVQSSAPLPTNANQLMVLSPNDLPPQHLLPNSDTINALDGDWSDK